MLRLSIFKELEQIPETGLADLCHLIYYFRVGLEQEQRENRTMTLAGAWVDMPDDLFTSLRWEKSVSGGNTIF